MISLVHVPTYIEAVKEHSNFGLCGCHISEAALVTKVTKATVELFTAGLPTLGGRAAVTQHRKKLARLRVFLLPNQLRDALTPRVVARPHWVDRVAANHSLLLPLSTRTMRSYGRP